MKHNLLKELRYLFILPLFFLTIVGAWAQGITVQGKVTDENNAGMPGVTVLLKGTSTGAAAGVDGSYSIDVPSASEP